MLVKLIYNDNTVEIYDGVKTAVIREKPNKQQLLIVYEDESKGLVDIEDSVDVYFMNNDGKTIERHEFRNIDKQTAICDVCGKDRPAYQYTGPITSGRMRCMFCIAKMNPKFDIRERIRGMERWQTEAIEKELEKIEAD